MNVCKFCKKEFDKRIHNQIFCSTKCKQQERYKKNREETDRIIASKFCVNCGTEFIPKRTAYTFQICCSNECSAKYQNKRARISGKRAEYRKSSEKYKSQKKKDDKQYINRVYFGGLREEALNRDKYSCQKCGEPQKEKIVVHHIDETPKENEVLDNLITLCRSCHAKEHHSGRDNARYKDISKDDIVEAIETTNTLDEAAKKLGITRSTLRAKRKKYRLPPKRKDTKGDW